MDKIFVTEEERKQVLTHQQCSGMWLSGGIALGNPGAAVESLRKKYQMPPGTALDPETGELISPVQCPSCGLMSVVDGTCTECGAREE